MRTAAITTLVIALVVITLQATVGAFPVTLFAFPLNILVMILWLVAIAYTYRNRTTSHIAQFMLNRKATWLSLFIMAVIGVVLGLERKPSSDAWAVVIGILFVLSHLTFVILRGWRTKQSIRWRFTITHIGLWLALGAGFWGAPDREQLRIAVESHPSREAYTIEGVERRLPYDIALEEFKTEMSENNTPTNYTARIVVEGESVVLRVNHPYNRTWSEKIYLINGGVAHNGSDYAIVEVVREPWQWLSAVGIVMLIVGGVLLFLCGPKGRR